MKNIHAYTAGGPYPEFISINLTGKDEYVMTVRSNDEKIPHIDITLTAEQLLEMSNDINKNVRA